MNLVFDFLLGVAGYQLKKWFGDEIMKYIMKPVFNAAIRPVLRPFGHFLQARLIKTEHQAELFAKSRHKASKKPGIPADIDSVTI